LIHDDDIKPGEFETVLSAEEALLLKEQALSQAVEELEHRRRDAESAIKKVRDVALVRAERKGLARTVAEDAPPITVELLYRLKSDFSGERAAALFEVARISSDDAFHLITEAFDDEAAEVRNSAARALFEFQPDRAASFTAALRQGSQARRRRIGTALAESGLAREAIGNLICDNRETTYDAFSVLFLMAKAGEVEPLMRAIEDHLDVEARLAVVKLLSLSEKPEVVPAFRRLAVRGSLPSEVRSAVMEAIYQISSQTSQATPSAA